MEFLTGTKVTPCFTLLVIKIAYMYVFKNTMKIK